MDVMLDIETMSTRLDALVLSIGAVEFTLHAAGPKVHTRMLLVLHWQQQLLLGRHVHQDTQRWWAQQTDEARAHWTHPSVPPLPVEASLTELGQYLYTAGVARKGGSKLWANGAVFDVGVLEHLYAQLGSNQPPWYYSNVRDARTVYGVCGHVRQATDTMLQQEQELHSHSPVDDCVSQINRLWCSWPGELSPEPDTVEEVKAPVT